MTFDKKLLIVGYGAVSQCTIPLLLKHVDISPEKITIIDFEDKKEQIKKYESQQSKVKNNREFDSLNKEIEFQNLEIQLSEKRCLVDPETGSSDRFAAVALFKDRV